MTVTASGIPLTLLSLERYREGDVLNFRFTSRRGLHLDFASPDMFITVGPASATATPRFSLMGGSSGGNGQEIVHRFSFGVTPGMPDGATDWVVEVTKIVWNRHRSGGEYTVANVDEGPWRFVIRP